MIQMEAARKNEFWNAHEHLEAILAKSQKKLSLYGIVIVAIKQKL